MNVSLEISLSVNYLKSEEKGEEFLALVSLI